MDPAVVGTANDSRSRKIQLWGPGRGWLKALGVYEDAGWTTGSLRLQPGRAERGLSLNIDWDSVYGEENWDPDFCKEVGR